MDYTMLRDVNKTSQNWTILVRAVRFCNITKFQQPQQRQRIDLILLDEEGTAMEAQVGEFWHNRSNTKLEEDHVYKIRYFRVVDAKTSYRATRHTCMAQFSAHTTIEEITAVAPNFPLYAHDAAPYSELATRVNNDEYTSDAIGILTACSDVRQQQTRNNAVKSLRTLLITDGSETISISLWGTHADEFDANLCLESAKKGSVVILFCGMTCRKFNDKLSLHSSMHCRWYINPIMDNAESLRQSMPPQGIQWLGGAQNNANEIVATVTELAANTNPHIIHDKKFTVSAKIKDVNTEDSWWYIGCNSCNKRLYNNGNSYRCSNTTCSSVTGKARYLLRVTAIDPHKELTDPEAPLIGLVFFGAAAEQVVGYPVQTLIEKYTHETKEIPQELKAASGKAFTIRVAVGNLSYESTIPTYQVLNIIGSLQVYSEASSAGQATGTPGVTDNQEAISPATVPEGVPTNITTAAPSTPAVSESKAAPSRKRTAETAAEGNTDEHGLTTIREDQPTGTPPSSEQVTSKSAEDVKGYKRNRSSAKKKLDFSTNQQDAEGKE